MHIPAHPIILLQCMNMLDFNYQLDAVFFPTLGTLAYMRSPFRKVPPPYCPNGNIEHIKSQCAQLGVHWQLYLQHAEVESSTNVQSLA